MIHLAAERLVTEWADRHRNLTGARLLIVDVLRQLADPGSDYGELLDDLCQRRWIVGQVREARAS